MINLLLYVQRHGQLGQPADRLAKLAMSLFCTRKAILESDLGKKATWPTYSLFGHVAFGNQPNTITNQRSPGGHNHMKQGKCSKEH
jgi:hypothetical protein